MHGYIVLKPKIRFLKKSHATIETTITSADLSRELFQVHMQVSFVAADKFLL